MVLAEEQLGIAERLLSNDKTAQIQAQKHVDKAVSLVNRATNIADVVKEFETNDFGHEDIVLWYQSQLSKVAKPLNLDLPLHKPNKHVVNSITNSISDNLAQLTDSKASNKQLSDELANTQQKLHLALQQQKSAFEAKIANLEGTSEEKRRKLEFVQKLFEEKEARVYLQLEDVIIRAQGFNFAPGQSEIDSSNFALLQKIAKAIDEYPGSTVMVVGHTDSTGHDKVNLQLSKERAFKVAKFLREFGGISPDRIKSDGFGEQQPVASNTNKEGRAENRRVEVIIKTNI